MFFSNLEMKNQNWTFINVLFSKIQNRIGKNITSFTSSASAYPISAALPLWCGDARIVYHKRLHYAVDCGVAGSADGWSDGWSDGWGGCLGEFLDG